MLLFLRLLRRGRLWLTLAGQLALLLAVTPVSAQQASEEDPDLFQPMDVFNLEWVTTPAVSPDGKTIAYTRRGYDIMKDRQTSRIWLVDRDGTNHRPMADRAGSSPAWSSDGNRIAFLSMTSQGVEIYVHWLEDNRTARITQLPNNPDGLEFSPNGKWLAFSMFTDKPADPMVPPLKAPEGASWAPGFKVFESVQYRSDGQGYLKPGFTHIYVVPAEGSSPRQVTTGNYNHTGGFSWAPDGQSLFVSANRRDDWPYETLDSEIYRIALADGQATALTGRYGPDTNPRPSPDGKFLAYVGFDDKLRGYENSRLYLMDLSSGETRTLTEELDRSAGSPLWAADGRSLYIQYDDHGNGQLARVNRNGQITVLTSDLGGTAMSRPYSGGSFHSAGGTVAYTRGTPQRPAELATVQRGRVNTLTNLNQDALGHKRLASIEAIEFPSSHDQRTIQAWIAKPADFDPTRRYPLILEIHGGPFAAYGPHFSSEVQLYAAAGYLVLYVNPRGSTSYGEDFANLIHHAYPGNDFDDLMSAVDYTIETGWTDPDRLYVTGGSGGGILTAWIVTHTDRFAAAVSAKPVINWYSFVLTADMYTFFSRYWFEKPPWEDPEAYLARSPLHFANRVTTPTMVLTGEADHRTPISESEQFYQALKLNRIDTALVRVPESSHGIATRPSNLIRKTQHVMAWFKRYSGAGD